jgi:hypothetical protein
MAETFCPFDGKPTQIYVIMLFHVLLYIAARTRDVLRGPYDRRDDGTHSSVEKQRIQGRNKIQGKTKGEE